MKIRSALLLAFMIVVPAAAMFSHRIPADIRRAMRVRVGEFLASVASVAGASAPSGAGGRSSPEAARPEGEKIPTVAMTGERSPSVNAAQAGPAPRPAPMPVVATGDRRLADLGAVAFDCRPVAGGAGGHQATCSVPLDASGQLLRVFHATGADGPAATAALVADVAAWRGRFEPRRAAVVSPAEPTRRF
jgi:hypothetical protein